MAVGDRTEKRLVGPVALTATANSTLGSAVASGRAWVVKQVVFCNTDGTDRLIYFAVNTTATVDNRIFWALPIAAGDTIIWGTENSSSHNGNTTTNTLDSQNRHTVLKLEKPDAVR